MQSKIEKISKAALQEAQERLSTLVGAEVIFSLQSASLMKKDVFMEHLDGASIVTGLLLKGTYRGDGCLVFPLKSAIKLSGKMIMLPPAEMNAVLAESALDDEMAAAFEEIPRMFITSFLEPFQNQDLQISSVLCRQSRAVNEQPGDAVFDYLTPEHTYYQVAAGTTVDGLDAGVAQLLLPAFILVCSPLFTGVGADPIGESAKLDPDEGQAFKQLFPPPSQLTFEAEGGAAARLGPLVTERLAMLSRELGVMAGASVSIGADQYLCVAGAEVYLALDASAHVSASFSLPGLPDQDIWVFAAPADALWLGTLLSEGIHGAVLARLQAGSFNADRQDGFREIGAVIINSFTADCATDSETDQDVVKKDLFDFGNGFTEHSEYSFRTDQPYQLCSLKVAAGALGSATVYLLFPESIVDLLQPESVTQKDTAEPVERLISAEIENGQEAGAGTHSENDLAWQGTVLVIDDGNLHGEAFSKELDGARIHCDRVTSLTEVSKARLESYGAIILIIEELNEMALGLTIKINSLCSVPLIAAASQWRQSEVRKAVRYGVNDILMIPAQRGEILQKLRGIERHGI